MFIEMELNKIRIDESRGEQVIVLKERGGERFLPIIIGIMEVTAIKMKLSGIESPRPMTHDLLSSVLKGLGAVLEKALITKLENGTFYAQLIVKKENGDSIEIDARPSDSIALALRTGSPIFVEEKVIEKILSGYNEF